MRDIIKMYIGLHVKYPLFLCVFNETCILQTQSLKKNTQVTNLMKISPVGAELCGQTDGRTNMTRLIVPSLNFANAPKKHENVGPFTLTSLISCRVINL
jgi:hypothetical protein